ncbi:MAG TPA: hypothetical protein VGO58_00100 [Chitinophagaceae bacterium]|jgi:hypothetical protein|nr:hypothetical protein [Chitinophagaceae bacterium]
MRSRINLFLFYLFTSFALQAQPTFRLHIVTSPDNRMQGFHFNFKVNGTHYKLKAGQCLELKLQADSVHILMEDTRWVKKETVDLHTAAAEHVYVRIIWGYLPGDKKRIRSIAEAICQACFEEYRLKCKKELAE